MAAVQLEAISLAYRGIFPPSAPLPSVAQLSAEWESCVPSAFVAVLDAVVVGTAVASPLGELRRLYVSPSSWGMGIGARLHDHVLETFAGQGFSEAVLWVLEANGRAGLDPLGGRLPGACGVLVQAGQVYSR